MKKPHRAIQLFSSDMYISIWEVMFNVVGHIIHTVLLYRMNVVNTIVLFGIVLDFLLAKSMYVYVHEVCIYIGL